MSLVSTKSIAMELSVIGPRLCPHLVNVQREGDVVVVVRGPAQRDVLVIVPVNVGLSRRRHNSAQTRDQRSRPSAPVPGHAGRTW